ncbi:MAG: NADH-quinone oxidoreductase subunit M [Myxococcaceae bacterium]
MDSAYSTRLLNVVIFSPAVFALLVMFLPKTEKGQIRFVALAGMAVNMLLCIWTWVRFDVGSAEEFKLEYRMRWVDQIGLSYHVGVDGLSVALVLLTGILGPLVVLASWTFINERVKEFHLALLLLQTAMLGALCSVDILLFYLFFEAMLIPMYLLIGVWGSEERQMAAMKFFIYTLVGSLLMLVALLSVYFISQPSGLRSFDYSNVYNGLMGAQQQLQACMNATGGCQESALTGAALALLKWGPWMFLACAFAFAIKVPMFPVHTWLPDAHVQAPSAGSIILAGVMLKMGTYGFWRFAMPLFPVAARQFQVPLAALAVIGIVYGALMSLAQKDIKKLIAYSSVSHLGYCMLGIATMTPEGATGSAYQMLNHGVSTGALFLLFGLLYERRHARLMSEYGGLAKVMPIYTTFFLIITFSSVAVPGTNGFVGEFLVLLGTFKSKLPMWMGVLAATGVILGAAYMLWMVQRVFFGQLSNPENRNLKDLNLREMAAALPLVVLVLVMGVKPQPILDVLNPSSERFISRSLWGVDKDHQDREKVLVDVRDVPAPALVADAAVPSLPKLPALQAPTMVQPAPPPQGPPPHVPPQLLQLPGQVPAQHVPLQNVVPRPRPAAPGGH